jgi:hypothetical protein
MIIATQPLSIPSAVEADSATDPVLALISARPAARRR